MFSARPTNGEPFRNGAWRWISVGSGRRTATTNFTGNFSHTTSLNGLKTARALIATLALAIVLSGQINAGGASPPSATLAIARILTVKIDRPVIAVAIAPARDEGFYILTDSPPQIIHIDSTGARVAVRDGWEAGLAAPTDLFRGDLGELVVADPLRPYFTRFDLRLEHLPPLIPRWTDGQLEPVSICRLMSGEFVILTRSGSLFRIDRSGGATELIGWLTEPRRVRPISNQGGWAALDGDSLKIFDSLGRRLNAAHALMEAPAGLAATDGSLWAAGAGFVHWRPPNRPMPALPSDSLIKWLGGRAADIAALDDGRLALISEGAERIAIVRLENPSRSKRP